MVTCCVVMKARTIPNSESLPQISHSNHSTAKNSPVTLSSFFYIFRIINSYSLVIARYYDTAGI